MASSNPKDGGPIESYAVRFRVNRHEWTERIARPINASAVLLAVQRKQASKSRNLWHEENADWHGSIYAGMRRIGIYVIDPASGERANHAE